jgi:hypothetical protein
MAATRSTSLRRWNDPLIWQWSRYVVARDRRDGNLNFRSMAATLRGVLDRIGQTSVIEHGGPGLDAVARASLYAPGCDAERKIA